MHRFFFVLFSFLLVTHSQRKKNHFLIFFFIVFCYLLHSMHTTTNWWEIPLFIYFFFFSIIVQRAQRIGNWLMPVAPWNITHTHTAKHKGNTRKYLASVHFWNAFRAGRWFFFVSSLKKKTTQWKSRTGGESVSINFQRIDRGNNGHSPVVQLSKGN